MRKIETIENQAMKIKWIEDQARAQGILGWNQSLLDLLNSDPSKLNQIVQAVLKNADTASSGPSFISTAEPMASAVLNSTVNGGAKISEEKRIEAINTIRGVVGDAAADRAIADGAPAENVALAHFQAIAAEEKLVDMLANSMNEARDLQASAGRGVASTDQTINDIVTAMNAGRGMENA